MADELVTQVKAAGDKADKLWEATYGKKEEGKTGEPAPEPEKEPVKEAVKEEPKKEEPKPEEDFKHKYDVLKGKYDKEVPSMAFQIGEQNKKITELETSLNEIKKPKEEPKPPIEENEIVKTVKKEYPDVAEFVTLTVKSMIDDTKKEIDQKFTKVDQDVGKVSKNIEKSDYQRFLDSLDSDPDIGKEWRTTNKDEDFIQSLQEVEPYSGLTKHQLLADAWGKMDTERVRKFFKDGKKASPAKEEPKKDERKKEEPTIHPPRGNAGSVDTGKDDKVPTVRVEELTKFYKDVSEQKWRGKEKEAEAEEFRLLKGLGIKIK
jgi:hypothetical protein